MPSIFLQVADLTWVFSLILYSSSDVSCSGREVGNNSHSEIRITENFQNFASSSRYLPAGTACIGWLWQDSLSILPWERGQEQESAEAGESGAGEADRPGHQPHGEWHDPRGRVQDKTPQALRPGYCTLY